MLSNENRLDSKYKNTLNIEDLLQMLQWNQHINSTLDLDTLLNNLMRLACKIVSVQTASLMLLNESGTHLEFTVALGHHGNKLKKKFKIKVGEGLAGTCAKTGSPITCNDTQSDQRFTKQFDKASGFQSKAILSVPMRVKNTVTGVLQVLNPLGRPSFSNHDVALMQMFADQAAIAISNANMHREILSQEQTRRELSLAKDIQKRFLPKEIHQFKTIEMAAKYRSARDIGGDLYDTVLLSTNQIGILIGDVSGKGVPASLMMVKILTDFRRMSKFHQNPAALLSQLNSIVCEDSSFTSMFTTLLFAIFDLDQNTLTFSRAGHEPLLHYHSKLKGFSVLDKKGSIPIGIDESAIYENEVCKFIKNDIFVAYTDGVTESRISASREYGLERLKRFIKKNSQGSKMKTVVKDLFDQLDSKDQHDDMTLIAMRI